MSVTIPDLSSLTDEQLRKMLVNLSIVGTTSGFVGVVIKAYEQELQRREREAAERKALEDRIRAQEEARAKEIADNNTREATKAVTEVFSREVKEKDLEIQNLKAEEDTRIKQIEEAKQKELDEKQKKIEEQQKELEEKNKTIQQYEKAINAFKEANVILQDAIGFKKLAEQFLEVAKENKYYLDLINTLKSPLDPLLMRATSVHDFDGAVTALRLGARVNVQDSFLETPLHKACAADDLQMVRLLLANGSDTTLVNKAGETADKLTSILQIAELVKSRQPKPAPSLINAATLFAQPPKNTQNNDEPSHSLKKSVSL